MVYNNYTTMPCRQCGQNGHNSKTCFLNKNKGGKDEESKKEEESKEDESNDDVYLIPHLDIIERLANDIVLELGAGHTECVYHNALKIGIQDEGLKYETERDIIIKYRERYVGTVRADIIINNELVIELKSCNATDNAIKDAKDQCKIYMRETLTPFGIVIIFPKRSDSKIKIDYCNNK